MSGKRFWTIAIAVIMLMIAATGYASAQGQTPTTTPTATTELPLTAIPDGTWLVGDEVPSGIYSAAGGAQCSWKRLSGFGGTFDDTIAGDFGVVRPIVEITPTDNGFSTSGCGLWTLVKPPSTPTPTPAAALTPTPTSTPTLVASATPRPVVKIPQGWKRIEDDRLGYSLAVPFPWLTFDLQSRVLDPVASLLGGEDAKELLREFLDSPEGSSLGILAVEPDLSQLFASPPFPMFLNVSIAPMPDEVTAEQLVAFVKRSAETLDDVQLHSIRTGAVNEMPALQVVASADLSGMGFDVAPHLVITILRANQTAYILTIATRSNAASAKQALIDQIVGTFRPDLRAPTATPTAAPTDMPTPTPEPAGVVKPGTYLVGADIDPGIYVGLAPEGVLCIWERLNSLKGDFESIIAIGLPEGLFYVELLVSDVAFKTECELLPIEQVPARVEFLTSVPVGTYLIGRDIAPGLYRGEASQGALCTWERLNSLTGDFESIIAIGLPNGQYFVEVAPSDLAVRFGCPVEKVE